MNFSQAPSTILSLKREPLLPLMRLRYGSTYSANKAIARARYAAQTI
ncbi:hypothetical protein CCACVL1_24420 [Corchorus capsularis]|uniref:Uncharacterized protein n=1 Tax=Corchorus capsularis TaxID=210143 RepID=A0A1R3GPP6_COCAP|nr:hypothetical protein CCACVL1_24420 [Corchorus capsularis]